MISGLCGFFFVLKFELTLNFATLYSKSGKVNDAVALRYNR